MSASFRDLEQLIMAIGDAVVQAMVRSAQELHGGGKEAVLGSAHENRGRAGIFYIVQTE